MFAAKTLATGSLLAFACCPCAHAHWFADASAWLEHDSNLSRAQFRQDIRADSALVLSGAVGRSFEIDAAARLSVTGEWRAVNREHFTGLSHVDAGLGVSWRRKFGLGPYAPWLRASAATTRTMYRDALRTGWLYDAGLAAGLRHTAGWESSLEWRYDRRTADREAPVVPTFSGAVFDTEGTTWSARTHVDVARALRVSMGYAQRRGDVTSTATHTRQIWDASTAWNKDPALGGDGYRINARTHMFNLGASLAIGHDSALEIGIDRWVSRANGGIDYYNTVVRVGLLASFF